MSNREGHMKRMLITVLVVCGIGVQNAPGQDFKKVIEIVGDLEMSLKKMIEQEQDQRKTDVANLKSEVQELRVTLAGHSGKDSSKSLSASPDLRVKVEALEHRVAEMHNSPDLSGVAEKLSSLLAELRKSIDESKVVQSNAPKASAANQQSVQMSGQAFAYYAYTTTGVEGSNFNRFDLDRVYLTAKSQIFDDAKVQLTTDIYRNSAAGTYYAGLSVRLKLAYVDYAPWKPLSIKFGMIPSIWPGFVDGLWKYRGIAPTITDKNSYFSSADLGASVTYTLPDKLGEVAGFMLNGNGYTAPESNRFKDFGLRAVLLPFQDDPLLKQITLGGYGYKGSNISSASTALQRDRYGLLLGYSYSIAAINAEYSIRKEAPSNPDTVLTGDALSFFGEVKVPIAVFSNTVSVVWRYDILEPNADKGGDVNRFSIVGLTFKPHEKLTIVLDRQWMKAETASIKFNDGTKSDYDGKWFLHTIFNF